MFQVAEHPSSLRGTATACVHPLCALPAARKPKRRVSSTSGEVGKPKDLFVYV